MIRLDISAACKIGCVRSLNEDMILVDNHFVRNNVLTEQASLNHHDRYLIAIADGMGGHNKGEVASSDTLRNIQFYYHDIPSNLDASGFNEVMVDWLESINNIVASKGRADEQYKGMGTTLVGLAYYCGEFYSLNCGDSRLYRFREGELKQLTTDHSLNNMLGSEKHTNIITNCIGGGCNSSFMDIVQLTEDVKSDDLYMLCTDGLTDMISDKKIAGLLAAHASANELCEAAIEAGGFDNVSCCIVKIKF